jgi:hypothetical protein
MKGGAISGNTSTNGPGGGVNLGGNAIFTMKNGEIRSNTAEFGGGVFVNENAEFIMENGEISGNTAKGGGGVHVYSGIFTMEGGEIRGNMAGEWGGGGVQVNGNGNATFTKKGGTIYGDTDTTHTPGSTENTATDGNGHAVATGKKRNATAGAGVKLYAQNTDGTWTYNDTSSGGAGDTTANWED